MILEARRPPALFDGGRNRGPVGRANVWWVRHDHVKGAADRGIRPATPLFEGIEPRRDCPGAALRHA